MDLLNYCGVANVLQQPKHKKCEQDVLFKNYVEWGWKIHLGNKIMHSIVLFLFS